MLVLELMQVEIDYCSSCGGIWLDSGELELLIERTAQGEILAVFDHDQTSHEKGIRCPKCSKKMAKVRPKAASHILVDSCNQGHGLWFDRGELAEFLKSDKIGIDNRILDVLRGIFKKKPNTDKTGG
jgi:hypothetical protein